MSYSFPTSPDVSLAGALPDLQAAEKRLRALATVEGITYKIAAFGDLRTESDTTRILKFRDDDYKLYVARMRKQGKTPEDINTFRPIAPFGHSYHNYGAAFDVIITSAPNGMTAGAAMDHLGRLAPRAGLRWGGTFPKEDTPHFELPITLEQAREKWNATRGLSGLIGLGIPGVSVIGSSGITIPTVSPATLATIQRHPVATATISAGALVALAMLTWVVVKRATDQ